MSNVQKLAKFISDATNSTTIQEPIVTGSGTIVYDTINQHKNYIINGAFDIWQRGTSQTNSGYGSADRWVNANVGSTKTCSQQAHTLGQTDIPSNPKYFHRTVVTSVAGASNYVIQRQHIENVTLSSGKTFTLSFYAKADATKNIAVEFIQSFGTGGTPSATVTSIGVTTFTLTTSWQKFTTTVTFPSVTGLTLGTNNDDYFSALFWFDAGSSFTARTNSLIQQSGTFDISQVQMEEGSIATNFEYRHPATELALCQRFYEKSFPQGTAPVQNATAAGAYFCPQVVGASTSQNCGTIKFVATKRAVPTVTFFNPQAANAQARNTSTGADCSSTSSIQTSTDSSINLATVTPATTQAGQSIAIHWTADAEIQ
jgi:hypothetical protein